MAVALLGDIKDFDQKMNAATGKVDTFDKSVKKMGDSVTKYAKIAAAAAVAAVTAFGVSSVKYFIDIDTGMREVFTLMPELSAIAKEEMMEDVQDLSEAIAVVPDEVIPALYQAISAGVPRENVFEFLEVAGRAAIGGVTELSIAVDGLTTVTNAYGSEIISVGEAADIMFTAVKFGKTTFDELSDRLFQAVPVAAAVGLEFGNIAASAAQITLSGVPMRVAMTQIRSLLNEVAFEGKELNKVFQEAAGMSFQQYIDAGGDIAGIIEILEGAAKKAGISIAELTSNLEAQGALLNLSGVNLDSLRSILDEMANSAGAADAAYEEMANGIQYQIDQLKVWWANLKLDIGGDLTESLKDLLGWLEEHKEEIAEWVKKVFDGLIDGLQWMIDNATLVKTALLALAVGFTALWTAANPAAASILAIVTALAWFESSGGVADAYDHIQGLAQSLRDLASGEEEVTHTTQAMVDFLQAAMKETAGVVQMKLQEMEASFFEFDDVMGEVAEAQQRAVDALKEGMRFDFVVAQFKSDVDVILDKYGYLDTEIQTIVESILTTQADAWSKATGVVIGSTQETTRATEQATVDMGQFLNQLSGVWWDLAADVEEAADEIADDAEEAAIETIGLGVGMTQEMREVWAEHYRLMADAAEQAAQELRDIVSSGLADMLWDLGTFHRKAQAAEEDHQQRMQDIITGAADRLADINLSDQRRREDLQTSHNRNLEDIAEWYQEQVEAGEANTHEKKLALDAQRQEKIEEVMKDHKRALEDLDTDYTRAIDDNADDREQALADELEAYEETVPKIADIFDSGIKSMVNSIIQSGIDKAADWVIAQLWNIAFEADAATAATNAALAGLGGGIGGAVLPIAAGAGALGIAGDIISGKSTFVNWLEDVLGLEALFGSFGWGSGKETGMIKVPTYAMGGIVPGPIGSPQPAIVHGGEPIGAAGFAEVLDYERLGNAVAVGVADALDDYMGDGRPIIVQLPDGTKLAQALYPPLQKESQRRGGTIL